MENSESQTINSINPLSDNTMDRKIKVASLDHAYQQSYPALLISLFCATIILISSYKTVNKEIVIIWYEIFVFLTMARAIVTALYFHSKNQAKQYITWKTLFVSLALLGGLSWGATGTVLFEIGDNSQQILIILTLAGITAGAAPLLAGEITAALLFVSSALLPLIYELFFIRTNDFYSLFDATVIAYYLYLIIIMLKLRKVILNSIALKFANDDLLLNISQAKLDLELTNKKLAEAATHDPLTKLANRSLFETNLTEAISRAKRNNTIVALFYIDLDNFKEVNDTYGHHIGDKLLLKLVDRLRESVRDTDAIARLGGDEITIILENIHDPKNILTIANQLCTILSKTVPIDSINVAVTASIGISIFPIDGNNTESLLKSADDAMYYVKAHGRNSYQLNTSLFN